MTDPSAVDQESRARLYGRDACRVHRSAMTSLTSRRISILVLLLAVCAQAQDLRIKKRITMDGELISSTETEVKGSRERIVTQSSSATSITIKQCDLQRTISVNEPMQAYFVSADPQDDTLTSGAPGGAEAVIFETSTVKDTGERKTMFGLPARHLRSAVTVRSSANACTQLNQHYEVDGWYVDLPGDLSVCHPFFLPISEGNGCKDRIVRRYSGDGKLGFPFKEAITLHSEDGSTSLVRVQLSNIYKGPLDQKDFEVPSGYREVSSPAELKVQEQGQTEQPPSQ